MEVMRRDFTMFDVLIGVMGTATVIFLLWVFGVIDLGEPGNVTIGFALGTSVAIMAYSVKVFNKRLCLTTVIAVALLIGAKLMSLFSKMLPSFTLTIETAEGIYELTISIAVIVEAFGLMLAMLSLTHVFGEQVTALVLLFALGLATIFDAVLMFGEITKYSILLALMVNGLVALAGFVGITLHKYLDFLLV